MNVGVALHDQGRDAEAEVFARRGVETLERLFGAENAQVATALLDWAEVLTALARTGEARAALDRALAIWTKLDAAPMFIEIAHVDLARIEVLDNHLAEARKLLERARPVLADAHPEYGAQASFLLANVLWDTPRDRARAVSEARAARQTYAKLGASTSRVAEVDSWLSTHAPP
jgi:hypothetical protein